MTVPYDREDKTCSECGEPVEDHTGHWHASEATLCDDCYDEAIEEWQYRAEVIHRVPRKEAQS